MIEGLLEYLRGRDLTQLLRDALDVLIVYYVFYRALLVLRGTRAMQVGLGLAIVFVLYLVAQWLQLLTVLSILGALISSIILVIVVVFQNDIRRGLMRVGSRAWLGSFARAKETKVIDEVVEAATDLARHRIGAIIAFEQDANLDEFVGAHKGHLLDAAVSSELLVSLFIPEGINKLHDGAVIIRNYRIAKAGVFFPMPEARVIDESFGSRHRAALGITEETDAVVVIVSEERGTISFCFNGNIASNLDGPKLRTMLEAIFSPKLRKKKRKPQSRPTPIAPEPEASSERVSKSGAIKTPSAAIKVPSAAIKVPSAAIKVPSGAVKTPSAIKTPTSERTPKPLKTSEAESTPLSRPAREDEPAPLRPRPAEETRDRDSEPPPPLRPRVLVEPEGPSSSVLRGSTPPPPPLRTPAIARPVEMPKTPLPVGVRADDGTDSDGDAAAEERDKGSER